MKILLINQTFYPELLATSQQVTDLALFLSEKGHQVTVYTGRRGYEERRKIFKRKEDWRGVHIERVHSTGFGKTSVFRRILDSFSFDLMLLLKLLFSQKFDLVVSFTSPPLVGLLGSLFCQIKGGRAVQWLMDVNPDTAFEVGYISRNSPAGRFLNWAFDWTLKNSEDVVVLDRWMKERIKQHGVPDERITVIPPWSVIDKNSTSIANPVGTFRKENSLEGKFVILYSGNHSVVHPLDTILQSALKLQDDKDVVFVFAGSGLRTRDVKEFKKRHALNNILQLPWQTREALKDSFRTVDLHLIVMGQNMSGLAHTSKIYSILSSGVPYLFIGPTKSHVVDLLQQCPGGKHVENSDIGKFVQEVRWFKNLGGEAKTEMGRRNQEYLATKFGQDISKSKFENAVILKQSSLTGFQYSSRPAK